MESFHLTQSVNGPTYKQGHTDLILFDACPSDHKLIFFNIPIPHSPKQTLIPFLIHPKRLNLPHLSAAFATSPLLMEVLIIAIFLMSYLHAVVHLAPTLWTQSFISNADGIN